MPKVRNLKNMLLSKIVAGLLMCACMSQASPNGPIGNGFREVLKSPECMDKEHQDFSSLASILETNADETIKAAMCSEEEEQLLDDFLPKLTKAVVFHKGHFEDPCIEDAGMYFLLESSSLISEGCEEVVSRRVLRISGPFCPLTWNLTLM